MGGGTKPVSACAYWVADRSIAREIKRTVTSGTRFPLIYPKVVSTIICLLIQFMLRSFQFIPLYNSNDN